MKKLLMLSLLLIIAGLALSMEKARDGSFDQKVLRKPTAMGTLPATDVKTHTVGQLNFTINNWGVFGSQRGENNPNDCYVSDTIICSREVGTCLPSGEFPACSNIEYLFLKCLVSSLISQSI